MEHTITITIKDKSIIPTRKDIKIDGFAYLIYPVKKLIIGLLKEKLK